MFDGRHLCVMIPSGLPVLWCFVLRRALVLQLTLHGGIRPSDNRVDYTNEAGIRMTHFEDVGGVLRASIETKHKLWRIEGIDPPPSESQQEKL